MLLAAAISIILAGQSNASGGGSLLPQDQLPDLSTPIIVLHPQTGIRDSQEPWNGSGTTSGRTLARYLWQHYPEASQVWVIACSQGSTSIAQWLPNASDGYLSRCLTMGVRATSFGAPPVGVVWMQGESDSGSEAQALMYGDRLRRVIGGFRQAYPGIPFVGVELPHNLPPNRMPYRDLVVEQTRNQLASTPQTSFVETGDLEQMVPGTVHWDRGPLRVIGTRAGMKLMEVLSVNDPSSR